MYTNFRSAPAIVRVSLDRMLAQGGIQPPKNFWIVEKYQKWAAQQASLGLDSSLDAFIATTTDEESGSNPYISVGP